MFTDECQTLHADRLDEFLSSNRHQPILTVDSHGRIVQWSPLAEAVTGHQAASMRATACCESSMVHIVQEPDGFSDQFPLKQTLADASPRRGEVFIRHRDGYWKSVTYRTLPVIDATGATAGAVEILSDPALQLQPTELDTQLKDPLTGLFNRKYLQYRLHSRYAEMQRYDWSFAVIMVRVDTRRGTQARDVSWGDRVVTAAGRTLAGSLRAYDVVGRWGDDEFLAIMPIKQAGDLAIITNRIRHLLAQTLVGGTPPTALPLVSLSAAVARKSCPAQELLEDLSSHLSSGD